MSGTVQTNTLPKQDLDSYNKATPLQAEFDFRDDMADREASGYQPPPDDED